MTSTSPLASNREILLLKLWEVGIPRYTVDQKCIDTYQIIKPSVCQAERARRASRDLFVAVKYVRNSFIHSRVFKDISCMQKETYHFSFYNLCDFISILYRGESENFFFPTFFLTPFSSIFGQFPAPKTAPKTAINRKTVNFPPSFSVLRFSNKKIEIPPISGRFRKCAPHRYASRANEKTLLTIYRSALRARFL